MPPERKKNDFLDVEESEDDQSQGYDSEADDFQKGGRRAKRRRVDEDDGDDDAADLSDDDFGFGTGEEGLSRPGEADEVEDDADDSGKPSKSKTKAHAKSKSKSDPLSDTSKTLTKKNLIASDAAIRRSGVVYLSRIPPYMKPQKLRTLLAPHGTINRLFLAPEDPAAHTRRVKAGGNKKRLFTEGWVEFTSKKDAKRACEMLNARPIGGKKGSYYRDDIWNLLYLKGFKWHNLTEQIATENAERASRMRAEIGRTTRENKEFVQNVERAKVMDGIKAKEDAKKKRKRSDGGADDAESETAQGGAARSKTGGAMSFQQVPLAARRNATEQREAQPEHVTRVLSKIF